MLEFVSRKKMGSQQSTCISPKLTKISREISSRNRRYSKSPIIKIRRVSSSDFLGQFCIPEEFSVDQLYDIYMQKHALDDLAFSMEFKVNNRTLIFEIYCFDRIFLMMKNYRVHQLFDR